MRVLALCTIFLFYTSLSLCDNTIVKTTNGLVQGIANEKVIIWKGIPFAAPPVGSNRWKAPQPVSSWSDVLQTTNFKPGCPQNCNLPPLFCPNTTSEDCLYLNVYAPKNRDSNSLLPVMVFIAGGAFQQGDGGCVIYDSTYLANSSAIVVTFNYRLGALGFLVTDTLTGNFGIQDQIAVLQWVQSNIEAFGGDKNQVTLFGESAGATSVGVHLVSSYSKGLFHRAIMESNPLALPMKTVEQSTEYGAKFASLLGCARNDITCMKSKNANDVTTASDATFPWPNPFNFTLEIALPWDPTVDGDILPEQPLVAFQNGNFAKMPVMLGTNSGEGVMFAYLALSERFINIEYDAAILAIFGEKNYEAVHSLYDPPLNPFSDNRPLLSQLVTDYFFTCPTRRVAQYFSQYTPTYLYQFDHVLSFNAYGPLQMCVNAVCHGAELPFVFHSADQDGIYFNAAEEVLATAMANYWLNFATSKSASPNGDNSILSSSSPSSLQMKLAGIQRGRQDIHSGQLKPFIDIQTLPAVLWPSFNTSTWQSIHFSTPIQQQTGLMKSTCDFWDTLGYAF